MTSKRIATALVMCSYALAFLPTARADEDAQWRRTLARINDTSPVEAAGSHGSYGVTVGAGAVEVRPAGGGETYDRELGTTTATDGGDATRLLVPKAWVVKGLPIPVDAGIGGASAQDGSFNQASAYAQWTVFEAFRLPAVSVRTTYGRIFGVRDADARAAGASVLVGYGFLRYFNVFAELGAVRNEVSANGTAETWIDPVKTAGLRVMAWPPFVAITAEARVAQGAAQSYAGKISLGM